MQTPENEKIFAKRITWCRMGIETTYTGDNKSISVVGVKAMIYPCKS